MDEATLQVAYKHSSRHRYEIASSAICGCFHCEQLFAPTDIIKWVDEDSCAVCPVCGIDSVLGSASGLPVTDREFLDAMHQRWFGNVSDGSEALSTARQAGEDPVVNVAAVDLHWLQRGSRFQVGLADLDKALGLGGLGATLHVVPAGKTAWPYHRHHGKDELFFVVSGSGECRMGDQLLPIHAGDCIGAPAGGEAHQIINSSAAELRYIAFANHGRADVIEYPDSGRLAVDIAHGNDKDPPSIFSIAGKFAASADYWDGEDIGE